MANITDAEIIELETLITVQTRFDFLKQSSEKTNPNYKFLQEAVNAQSWEFDDNGKPQLVAGYAGCILEGSSRSGKTWSGVDLIIWLCAIKHAKEGCTINIYRETYNEFKDTLYDDFSRRLDYYDLPNKFKNAQEVKSFKIGNSKISFLGDGKHGGGCDYAFFNEAMMISQSVFDQVEMRCRKFWWMDYNPSFTEHWVFDSVANRKDVGFIRTTFKDNLDYISAGELNKILSYEPWKEDSYYVDEYGILMYQGVEIDEAHQPPQHEDNTESGTADESMWCIYGLGLRGAMKGLIFSRVRYIEQWPEGLAHTYGMDFGFTADPTCLVKYGQEGKNIYLELLLHQPIDNVEDLDEILTALGISKYVPITADSSDRYVSEKKGAVYMVRGLFEEGWEISKVSKTKNVMYWLMDMKGYMVHIIINDLSHHAKKEQQNYKFKEINGIMINQPNDKFNHFWDGGRYAHMAHDSNNFETVWN